MTIQELNSKTSRFDTDVEVWENTEDVRHFHFNVDLNYRDEEYFRAEVFESVYHSDNNYSLIERWEDELPENCQDAIEKAAKAYYEKKLNSDEKEFEKITGRTTPSFYPEKEFC